MIFDPETLVIGFIALEARISYKRNGIVVPDSIKIMETGRFDRDPPTPLFEYAARRLQWARNGEPENFSAEEVISETFGAYEIAQQYVTSSLQGIALKIAYGDVHQQGWVVLETPNILNHFTQMQLCLKLAEGMYKSFPNPRNDRFFPLEGLREAALDHFQTTARTLRQYPHLKTEIETIMDMHYCPDA